MPFTDSDCRRCREDFPALGRTLADVPLAYFDGPGGTQVPRPVIAAVSRYYETCNSNTHGEFVTSADTDEVLHTARATAAAFLGAEGPGEISFGANMTSLTFSLSHALGRTFSPGDEVVITQLDHEANRGPWLGLEERGMVVKEARMTPGGLLDMEDLERQVGERTRLVAIGGASNALGTVNDLGAAVRLARSVGAYTVVDAVHYAPHIPVDVVQLGVDFLLCSAYKFYGPHVGILYSRPGLLDELPTDRLRTQEQEAPYRIETGTLNHAALAGATAAVEYLAGCGEGATLRERVRSAMEAISRYERELGQLYYESLQEIAGVTVWGPDFTQRARAPTVSITIDGVSAREASRRLGRKGLLLWDGHFYAIRAVEVLGLAERGGLLRSGVSLYNTREEIERLVSAIGDIAAGGD